MNIFRLALFHVLALALFMTGFSAKASPPPPPESLFLAIPFFPGFIINEPSPLMMLVIGRDQKNYFEAYNDASDLNGDGVIDVGFKPDEITYIGYFNSFACYLWDAADNRFEPVAATTTKRCSGGAGQWSGDFLNYLTTSRKDALRRVLYGGWRHQDTPTDTTLQGAFFPQDAHSWGKEYQSIERDGFDIRQFAPLPIPPSGTFHLFAVTTTTGNDAPFPNYQAPMLRVMQNTTMRVWNWLSIEGAVAGNRCVDVTNNRVSCLDTGLIPGGVSLQNYFVRVQTCPSNVALHDSACRFYHIGNVSKPTGVLHDYGWGDRRPILFGLITGSQRNNLEGGVLRRNIGGFWQEINPFTGQFRPEVNGIVNTLNRLRMIGGAYRDGVVNNMFSDAGWSWELGTGNCPSIGHRPINNRECRMWGNPVGEMLYESMRYYAGAGVPTTRFFDAPAGSQGMLEETRMGLPAVPWIDPFRTSSTGSRSCTRPFQMIISDINPSYDGDLPGSPFSDTIETVNDTPPSIAGFDAAAQGQVIWNHEFGAGSRQKFIGEVAGGLSDGAPTAKSVSSLGNIRGLAPEEPGKLGTFNTAAVARFARVTDVSASNGVQNVSTLAMALSSPLPRIEFPIGGSTVRLLPFAKTVSGTFGAAARKPTNAIVDFYIESMVNFPGSPTVVSVNGGRPFAIFRINFEDVEQGKDHDMGAIVRYEVAANADGTVTVHLNSERAEVYSNQNIGYVISGTTADGVYLEVRNLGGPGMPWDLNTPPGATTGQCALPGALSLPPCNVPLPPVATRTFTPAAAATGAKILRDPLWFAAKYGGFREDAGGDNLPVGTEWDRDGNQIPDNYFLVTSPLQLQEQFTRAFDLVLSDENEATGALVSTGSRINSESQEFVTESTNNNSVHDFTGDVRSYRINPDGTRGSKLWSATTRLAATSPSSRRLFTTRVPGNAATRLVVPFQAAEFGASRVAQLDAVGLSPAMEPFWMPPGTTGENVFAYLRGDGSLELDQPGGSLRTRSGLIGTIVHSQPEVSFRSDVYRWIGNSELRTDYQAFITAKRANVARPNLLFVNSNNGFLHAFEAESGNEVFGFMPARPRQSVGQTAMRHHYHIFLMDGDLTAADARLGGSWASVLLGSAGRGGWSVFALDITNPQSFSPSNLLWELEGGTGPGQDRDIGNVIGRLHVMFGEDGGWYAVFGNGFNSMNGNPVLMIVNLQTGVVTRKLVGNDDASATNGLINIALVDANDNGRIDTVYGGDLQGNLWKFDLSAASSSAWSIAFSGNPLFTATDSSGIRQPITGGIDVARGAGGLMVYFGTGRLISLEDHAAFIFSTPQIQSLYGVRDNGVLASGNRVNLQAQSILTVESEPRPSRMITNNPVNFGTQRGWYLDLILGENRTGESFTGDTEVRNGVVFFPTNELLNFEVQRNCKRGGRNWMYGLDAITGGSALGGTQSISGGTVCTDNCGAIEIGFGSPSPAPVFVMQTMACRPGIDPDCSSSVPTPEAISAACGALTGEAYQACVDGLTSGRAGAVGSAQTRCGDVERHTGVLFERACGRQSWRQVR